jgi:hypothetical protein
MNTRISLTAAVLVVSVLIGQQTTARDANGFWVGGGVGALKCPDFLNAMATARQKGGVESGAGGWEIVAYADYVLGFQTGFNSEAEGIYDIFESFGSSRTPFLVLYAIEPWCATHPDKTFATALLVLAQSLRDKIMEGKSPR